MSLNDQAVFLPGKGHFYRAASGTACPTDLTVVPPSAWTEIGHTSLSSILGFASSGGDATSLGTLQAPVLRQTFSTRTETMNFTLEQWDAESLKLYFGSNMVDINGDGSLLGVNTSPTPTESALLIVLFDGANSLGIWAPQTNLYRGSDASIDSTDALAGLPIAITPLVYNNNQFTYAVTPVQAAA